jgi:flagellar basal body rod protein FlgC
MAAASLRLEVSASNIANMSDTGPLPGTNAPNAAGCPAAYEKQQINVTSQRTATGGKLECVTAAADRGLCL